MTTVREEIQNYVAVMQEEDLVALRPLCLRLLYGGKVEIDIDNEPLVIETDLTDEEKAIIQRGRVKRAAHPESYISLDDYIRQREVKEG